MKIQHSSNPAQKAGEHITNIITDSGRDVFCILSGGSTLEVVKYLALPPFPECRTIFMMGDEQVSRGIHTNNYLQLENRYLGYRILDQTIQTVPEEAETAQVFAQRIQKTFEEKLSELTNPHIVALLGIGTDGQTASIFPMERNQFQEAYPDDVPYISVKIEGAECEFRTTFTPTWLLNEVKELIGYAVGENKSNIVSMLTAEQKPIHERPAEIFKQHTNAYIYTDLDTASA
jgi:6-phosphogluconolactonase/glucosamine-6-phosphate isomerase/deaminase